MEDFEKYRLLNRQFVLENQKLRENVAVLSAEITNLRQDNLRLSAEFNKYKNLKKKLVKFLGGMSHNVNNIVQLIYPNGLDGVSIRSPVSPKGVHGVSIMSPLATPNGSDSCNPNTTPDTERNTLTQSAESQLYVSKRRRRRSSTLENTVSPVSSSPPGILVNGNGGDSLNQTDDNEDMNLSLRFKRRRRLSVTLEKSISPVSSPPDSYSPPKILINGNGEDSLNQTDDNEDGNSSSSTNKAGMSTIVEEETIGSQSCFFSNSVTVKRNLLTEDKLVSVSQDANVSQINAQITTDNITISNVPCSTPYQNKRSCIDDDIKLLKKVRVNVIRLSPDVLNKYIKSNEEQDKDISLGVSKPSIRSKRLLSDSDDISKLSCSADTTEKRTRRTAPKCLAEPSLRKKLRRE